MRYVSLFSGVEAATVAWSHLGWEPLAFAEVDEFPSAVLACRFPNVPNLGDVCKIDWEEFYGRHGAVDVLIGGSPCQSFSIAGGREGLKGESRLMFEYVRAVRDLVRASGGASPRYIVWENVPGCLSSNKGRDFGCLLDALEDCGYFVCWRTLDSQFARVLRRESGRQLGPVPQRRRRVFLVGSLGGPSAADILFERTSLRGDHPSSREAREALARDSESGAGLGHSAGFKYHQGSAAGGVGYEVGSSPKLTADYHQPAVLTPWDVQSKRVNTPSGTSPTLQSGTGEGMNIQPIVLQGDGSSSNGSQNGRGYSEDGSAYTLNGRDKQAVCIQGSMVGRDDANGPRGAGCNDDVSFTLNCTDRHAVAFTQNQRDEVRLEGLDGSLVGSLHTGSGKNDHFVMSRESVICAADDNGKTAVEEDLCGSLKVGGSAVNSNDPYVLSNGDDVIGALCSCDSKWVQNQQVNQGKIICQKRK